VNACTRAGVIDGATLGCEVFEQLRTASGRTVSKSRAAAYAVISYQTAYIKAHYAVDLFAALLTRPPLHADSRIHLNRECKRLGIAILPLHVNRSSGAYSIEQTADGVAIRAGFTGSFGARDDARIEALVRERETNGEFKSFAEFQQRLGSEVADAETIAALLGQDAFAGMSRATSATQVD
jgi:DNA polymerase-3 subunit alpha